MASLVSNDGSDGGGELFSESVEEECRESSSSFEASSIEEKHGNDSGGSEEWISSVLVAKNEKAIVEYVKPKCSVSDIDMMKERFAKLLLGEDMSGCGHGACTALTISNAITNLSATLFGQLWRLEPLPSEKKSMWKREMEWLLCVSDHIVELKPSRQIFPDGSESEVMTCRPRPDLCINLPALRKLDNMLLEILDNFCDSEFKYADKGIKGSDTDVSTSFRMSAQRQVEKWWLPMLQVPPGGLSESSRKKLQHKHECTNQILKAVMAINSNTLAEMQVPQSYLDSLPKNVRECLGDVMYRNITSDKFSPECFLDCLEFTSEHRALEIANSVEASIYIWRQNTPCPNPRASWGLIREKSIGTEKRELFAARAESLLSCLKNRFPGLSQTSLDTIKIQFNKDVGKSILESYSRVLESLASNIVARIDDVLYIDDLVKKPEVPPVTSTTNRIALLPNSNNNNSRVVPARLPSPGIGKKSPLRTRIPSGFGFTFRE